MTLNQGGDIVSTEIQIPVALPPVAQAPIQPARQTFLSQTHFALILAFIVIFAILLIAYILYPSVTLLSFLAVAGVLLLVICFGPACKHHV